MSSSKDEFVKKLRREAKEESDLLQIQHEMKKAKYDKQKVYNLVKDLSPMQRKKLKEMYIEQNNKLKYDLVSYKNKIIEIRKRLNNKN